MADLAQATAAIIQAGVRLDALGWAPAGAGNYSHRLDDGRIAITVSGALKGRLHERDVMTLDRDGRALEAQRPSAETRLHLMLYARDPKTSVVLHTHSIPAVVLSRLMRRSGAICFEGYELQKAFPGVETHQTRVELPVLDNSQDMDALSDAALHAIQPDGPPAFLIRDHGLYAWGDDMDRALVAIEAAETLLACELELIKAGHATRPREIV